MVAIGAVLALAAGIGFNAAAALQKREALTIDAPTWRLIALLARRPVWLLANGISLCAWMLEIVALALAPVAVVLPVVSMGAVLLVFLGRRWFGERFGRAEIAAIGLVIGGGTIAAVAAGGTEPSRDPLEAVPLAAVAALGVAAALAAVRGRLSGIRYGLGAGFLAAATVVYSKELGNRFAAEGWGAIGPLAAGPIPWLLVGLSVGLVALVQTAYRRANAASVNSAMAAPAAGGPILAGFLLYREPFPAGIGGVSLVVGLACAVGGVMILGAAGRGGPASLQERAHEATVDLHRHARDE